MKTSMSITVFFFIVTFFTISASSLSPEETCIQRNIDRTQTPRASIEPKTSKFDSIVDMLCRDIGRAVMFSMRITGKFPSYYVKAMCNVFGNDEKKVKDYVLKNWLGDSKLLSTLSCAL